MRARAHTLTLAHTLTELSGFIIDEHLLELLKFPEQASVSLEKLPRGPGFGRCNASSFLASLASMVTHDRNSRERGVVCRREESKRKRSCVRLATWRESWSALLGGFTEVVPGRIYFTERQFDQVHFWLNGEISALEAAPHSSFCLSYQWEIQVTEQSNM